MCIEIGEGNVWDIYVEGTRKRSVNLWLLFIHHRFVSANLVKRKVSHCVEQWSSFQTFLRICVYVSEQVRLMSNFIYWLRAFSVIENNFQIALTHVHEKLIPHFSQIPRLKVPLGDQIERWANRTLQVDKPNFLIHVVMVSPSRIIRVIVIVGTDESNCSTKWYRPYLLASLSNQPIFFCCSPSWESPSTLFGSGGFMWFISVCMPSLIVCCPTRCIYAVGWFDLGRPKRWASVGTYLVPSGGGFCE